MDISGNLTSVKFSGIPKLIKSGGFFRCRVDISKNLRLINLSRFPKFQFKVRVVNYKAFLLATRGGK
jgi:hypothetical protein